MKKVYFLCPKCKKLLPSMIEVWEERPVYETKPVLRNMGDTEHVITESEKIDGLDGSRICTGCPKCGFLSESHTAEEFTVLVNEEGNIHPYGEYWEIHGLPEDIDRETINN